MRGIKERQFSTCICLPLLPFLPYLPAFLSSFFFCPKKNLILEPTLDLVDFPLPSPDPFSPKGVKSSWMGIFQGIFPDQLDVDTLGFPMWEPSQKAVCRHGWLPSLRTMTWKQQHLLLVCTGCREMPLHASQTSLPTGPQGGMIAEASSSHLLPWSHPRLPWPARPITWCQLTFVVVSFLCAGWWDR